jgi:hypothetical protein
MSPSVHAEVTPVTLGQRVRVKLLPVLPVLPMNEWMSGNDGGWRFVPPADSAPGTGPVLNFARWQIKIQDVGI